MTAAVTAAVTTAGIRPGEGLAGGRERALGCSPRTLQRSSLANRVVTAEQAAADPDRREPPHATGEKPPRGCVQRAVAREIAGRDERLLKRHASSSSRLGQDLGILQIEPSTECKPACSECEARPGSDLPGIRRGTKSAHGLRREAVGPDKRQP